ncbi:MAG: inositol monophosphatase [Bacteroidales bacterium]|jgi:myo-inositol-1(or 4)-monophosphatase|nr:inositol monophosphatase [Bacteroidales bacterium]
MNYEEICAQAREIVKQVGVYVRREGQNLTWKDIETKGTNDFVTAIDKASEERLVAALSQLLPEAGFIAEEQTSTKRGEVFNWIIDPIDGTTNFIHGLPPHAISVALMQTQELVVGIVYEITRDECFYSWKGGKSYCNEREIHVSNVQTIEKSLIITGFPYNDHSRMIEFEKTMNHFMKHSHGLRRLGSAATDLAYVACGRADAFYEYALKAWDVAAGAIILRNAGGEVMDFSGNDDCIFSGELISCNGNLKQELLAIIEPMMKR